MSKFSDEERQHILAEARAILARSAPPGPLTRDEIQQLTRDKILQQALAQPLETRNERDRREITEQEERRMNRAKWTTDSTFARRLEAKCAAMIDEAKTEQKDHITQLLTEMLAAFRDDLMGEANEVFAKLRAEIDEVRKLRGANGDSENREPIDLPNPLAARRLQ